MVGGGGGDGGRRRRWDEEEMVGVGIGGVDRRENSCC